MVLTLNKSFVIAEQVTKLRNRGYLAILFSRGVVSVEAALSVEDVKCADFFVNCMHEVAESREVVAELGHYFFACLVPVLVKQFIADRFYLSCKRLFCCACLLVSTVFCAITPHKDVVLYSDNLQKLMLKLL